MPLPARACGGRAAKRFSFPRGCASAGAAEPAVALAELFFVEWRAGFFVVSAKSTGASKRPIAIVLKMRAPNFIVASDTHCYFHETKNLSVVSPPANYVKDRERLWRRHGDGAGIHGDGPGSSRCTGEHSAFHR